MILERSRRTDWPEARRGLGADQDAMAARLGRPEWRVELALVDDAAMRELNARFRGRDSVTDVLSFPVLDDEGVGVPDLAVGVGGAACDLWLDPVANPLPAVGEIVMAPAFIVGRCRERGWDPEDEVAMLTAHGLLHLLGWDHRDEGERRAMQAQETVLLAACGRPHPLRAEEGN